MKVLFVCPFVPWPLVDGGKIRTFNLIKEAASHAEIHLRIVREPGQAEDTEDALRPWCGSLRFFERGRLRLLQRVLRPKLERWFHSPALLSAVHADLAAGDFHLVHLDELLLARVVPPDPRVPVIQHHHKLDTILYARLSDGLGPKRHFDLWKLQRLEAESTRRYRHHLTCSAEDAAILKERYGALDCAVVPSGFDPALFRPTEPPAPRVPGRIVFLGSMNYGPNVDGVRWFVRDVFPMVRARHPGATFEIVGGEPTAEVSALAGDAVTVTGRVPDVRPYLAAASLLAVPLRIGGGTRLKIVEALGLATPVVSTRVGAEGLGLVDREHLRLADTPAELAAAIGALLEAPDEAAALGRRGRRAAFERYRWEVLAEELVDTWERVAHAGKRSPSR